MDKKLLVTNILNKYEFGQEPLAQIQLTELKFDTFAQEAPAQIKNVGKTYLK